MSAKYQKSRMPGVAMLLLGFMAGGQFAQACSVCFGDPASPLSKGLAWGVAALLGVVVCVLSGFVGFVVYLNKRGKQINAARGGVDSAEKRDGEAVV